MAKKIKQNKNKNKNKTAVKKMEEKIKLEKSRSKYASGKLCKIVDRQIADYKVFDLKTPFGKAIIQKRTKNNSFVLKNPGDYEGIVNTINASGENTVGNIKKILKYLSIKSNREMKDIDSFNDEISKKMTMPDDIKSQALTNLCGVLMFSEPYRFKDGGGVSRCYIRKAINDLAKDNEALSKIFGRHGREFKNIPEAEAVFAHKDEDSQHRKYYKSEILGGKAQMENVIYGTNGNESEESINDNKKRLEDNNEFMSDNEDEDTNIKINKKKLKRRSKRETIEIPSDIPAIMLKNKFKEKGIGTRSRLFKKLKEISNKKYKINL